METERQPIAVARGVDEPPRLRWCEGCQRMQPADYGSAPYPTCAVCGQCQCDGCVSRWGQHAMQDPAWIAQRDAIEKTDRRARLRRARGRY